jgi:hypothetical protein
LSFFTFFFSYKRRQRAGKFIIVFWFFSSSAKDVDKSRSLSSFLGFFVWCRKWWQIGTTPRDMLRS